MNFRKFLVEAVFYHGTTKDAAANIKSHGFDMSRTGSRQKVLRGGKPAAEVKGIYLTPDADTAEWYASADYQRPGTGGGEVVSVQVDDSKLMPVNAWMKIKYDTLKELGIDDVWDIKSWQYGIDQAVEKAKQMGYIGIRENDSEYVVFSPRDVKVVGKA